MKLIRTIKIKLNIPVDKIKPTIDKFTEAYNYCCQIGFDQNIFNGVQLHHETYKETRKYLPSQLTVSARMKATESLKSVRQRLKKKQKAACPQSRQCSVRYDARSFNVWFDRNEISLLTINGRKKFLITVPEYFKQYLDWKRCSADLFIRKGKIFLHIVFEKDVEDVNLSGNIVGIDRGINKLAVTSDNKLYNGGEVKRISKRYEKLRQSLQSCGSRSAKRHLQRLSKKENRFRRDVNHVISKKIVNSIPEGSVIVLEDLKSIRQRARLRKKQRKELHKWNFFQLEQFITYKAEASGIKVDYVDSRYTSQKCSVCKHVSRSNRQSQSVFKCKHCGFSLNADLNASRNIKQNYQDAICHPDRATVNLPIVAHDDVKASNEELRRSAVTSP